MAAREVAAASDLPLASATDGVAPARPLDGPNAQGPQAADAIEPAAADAEPVTVAAPPRKAQRTSRASRPRSASRAQSFNQPFARWFGPPRRDAHVITTDQQVR
jgi:hypothetical protein